MSIRVEGKAGYTQKNKQASQSRTGSTSGPTTMTRTKLGTKNPSCNERPLQSTEMDHRGWKDESGTCIGDGSLEGESGVWT